jgi:hypothetical protein
LVIEDGARAGAVRFSAHSRLRPPSRPERTEAPTPGAARELGEQGRLADAGLTSHDKSLSLLVDLFDQGLELAELGLAAEELARAASRKRSGEGASRSITMTCSSRLSYSS